MVLLFLVDVFVLAPEASARAQSMTSQGEEHSARLVIPADEEILRFTPAEFTYFFDRFNQEAAAISGEARALYLRRVREMNASAMNSNTIVLQCAAEILHFTLVRRDETLDEEDIEKCIALEKQAAKSSYEWMAAEINHVLADYYNSKVNLAKALWHRKLCCELLKGRDPVAHPRLALEHLHLGSIYQCVGEMESALFFSKEALHLLNSIGDQVSAATVCNNLGSVYRELEILDTSDIYFRKEAEITQHIHDTVQWSLAQGNLGENQFLRGNYEAAKPLLQIDLSAARGREDYGVASNALLLLAEISISAGDLIAAGNQLDSAEIWVKRSGQAIRYSLYYAARLKYFSAKKDLANALLYIDSLEIQRNRMAVLNQQSKAMRIETLFAMHQEQLRAQNLAITVAQNEYRQRRIILALVIAVVVIILVMLLSRRRSRRKIDTISFEKKLVEERLTSANDNLDKFLRAMAEGNRRNKKSVSESEVVALSGASENAISRGKLGNMVLLTHQNWADFSRLFEEVHPGFLVRLSQRYPEITQAEIRFLALLRLDIDTESMRAILAVGPESIRQARHRLRKKMQLSQGDNMREVIGRL